MTQLTITREDGPPETMRIEFSPPLPFKGGELAELALREPTAKEVREAEKQLSQEAPYAGTVAYELRLIALVAGITADAADALPVGATNYAAGFLQEFVERGAKDFNEEEDAAEEPAPEPETMAIHPPLAFAGVTYTEMDLREPLASEIRKARQLLRTSGSLFETRRAQMQLVASVTGLPAPVVDAMPITLLNQAARLLGRFIVVGRRTGKR